MRAPTAREMYRRSQLSRSSLQLGSDDPLLHWSSGDDEDTNTDDGGLNIPGVDAHGNPLLGDVVEGVHTLESIVVDSVLSPVESFVSSVVHNLIPTPPTLTSSPSVSLPFVPVPSDPLSISLSLPITLPTSWPASPLTSLPLPMPTLGYTSSDAPLPFPTQEPTTPHTSTNSPNTEESITSIFNTETSALPGTTNQLSQFAAITVSGSSLGPFSALPSYAFFASHAHGEEEWEEEDGDDDDDDDGEDEHRPEGSHYGHNHTSSVSAPMPSLSPGSPSNPPGTPSPRTISITFSTLLIILVAGVAGLLWWRKRQNKQGVNMFGRRLEFGETPGAWSQIESGEGTGYGAVEKKGKAKEVSRNEADVGYGTIQRGGMLHNTSASAGERRPRKLPVITPILTWVKARSRSKAHKAEQYGANSGTLPRARKARQRQSLSPASLPSSSNTSLRSGSFISSDENDVSIYMHDMQDDDSLTPSPSPRSLSMSMGSRLSRISGSTDDLSEFEASPRRGRSRKRRDSQSSSSSEETSDTRSSFGFVRPVVATTGGATPSVFTATGHYITNNASTTTLASPPPRTSTPPETTSNQGSPYGPGLDFFSARAWRKPQTAGPSLMEVVNSWSAPPSPGGVEQGYRSISGGSSRPS